MSCEPDLGTVRPPPPSGTLLGESTKVPVTAPRPPAPGASTPPEPTLGADAAADGPGLTQVVLTEVIRTTAPQLSPAGLPTTDDDFHEAFDGAAGIGLTDLDGRLLQVNPPLRRLLDRPAPRVDPVAAVTATDASDAAGSALVVTQGSLDALVCGGRTSVGSASTEGHRAGSTVHVLVSVTDVLDEHGSPSHLVVRVDDVADYVRHTD